MGPKAKLLPIHNAAMTGRACNNNGGTEVWSIATMEELLLPILGQIEIVRGGKVIVGKTGEVISVSIGMVVGEEYGRIMPHRAFHVGQTAHRSGEKAKGLKAHIPVITCDKKVLARYIIQALDAGMVPGRDIGPCLLYTSASGLIICAQTKPELGVKGLSAIIVEKGTPGFTSGKIEEKMGLAGSETAELVFEDCRVPAANLVGKEGQGFKLSLIHI